VPRLGCWALAAPKGLPVAARPTVVSCFVATSDAGVGQVGAAGGETAKSGHFSGQFRVFHESSDKFGLCGCEFFGEGAVDCS
jgi:hypothetical protein